MKYRPSLRKRIYLTVGLVVLISFIAIGTVTLVFFKSQNEDYHRDRLERKQAAVTLSIDYFLSSINNPSIPDSLVRAFDNKICELANVNSLDINIYNLNGEILINSNPEIFDSEFVNYRIDSAVLVDLSENGHVIVDIEQNGNDFLNTFKYINNELGEPIAILNLPYFASNDKQRIEVLEFLKALAEIYLVLLIIALSVGWLLSRYITQSLREIGSRISKIQINQKNQSLVWNSNDEIGQLVAEYNKKLVELEKSAEKLALSERQSAWKEMAKQVAHEIKNPLTPLKLNIQLLERSLKPDDPEFDSKLKEFCKSTVQQIDTLTSIASAFSSFAALPHMSFQQLEINEFISGVLKTYKYSGVEFSPLSKEVVLLIDPDQFTRVINNIVQNAIQAIPEERQAEIKVAIHDKGTSINISFEDNGSGIEIEDKARIFEPSFTTKTSGMGLGLAMVKNIVESHHGAIWFETNSSLGTTFYISLPKA